MASDSNDHQHESQPFLRQPPHPSPDPPPSKTPEKSPSEPELRDGGHLSPDAGPTLDEGIMQKIAQWSEFSVLTVQLDLPDDEEVAEELHEALAAILVAAADPEQTLWFHWKGPLYGCLLPGSSVKDARNTAAAIQAELARQRQETVTIGIAPFPLIDFSRRQTLANACKALDHAAFFGPGGVAVFDAVSLNISGDRHYQHNRMRSAIAEYENALRLDAGNVNVHNSLGVCRAEMQEYDAAEQCFYTALDLEPEESMATYNLGVVHLLQENHQQALDWFKKAYALNTGTFEIPYHIGKVLVEQDRCSKAIPFLEKSVALRSDNSSAFSLLGKCLDREDRIREAIDAYKRAVKLNPNDAAALSALGRLYDQKGENPDICLTFSRQSVALAPQNGAYRFHLARLYQKHGYPDLAMAEYDQAAALGHDFQSRIDELNAQTDAKDGRATRCA